MSPIYELVALFPTKAHKEELRLLRDRKKLNNLPKGAHGVLQDDAREKVARLALN